MYDRVTGFLVTELATKWLPRGYRFSFRNTIRGRMSNNIVRYGTEECFGKFVL